MKKNLLDINHVKNQEELSGAETISMNDIAIIGIAGKFPMSNNIDQFWDNLRNGVDSISILPEARLKDCQKYIQYTHKGDVKFIEAAFLEAVDKFDYKFFKLSPKEASLMDPVQRLFLETSWQAIEDAGYGGQKLSGGNVGVYLGFEPSLVDSYGKMIFEIERSSLQICAAGNIPAIIPKRISYILNLKGPTMAIDTACSSSLVAIHLACQAIKSGDCNMAIAGGVKLYMLPFDIPEEKLGIESSDFRTKSFDDSSDGTGSGEGVAALILKPFFEALKDQDHIYAVIKGSAINQDGSSANITAPNALAQADVIEKAWRRAGVHPDTISYIEAHGTGTKIGDPIEIEGITKAFERYTGKKQFCGIGSVKTNIGHLYEASGIVGLIKVVLSLKHGEIPPTLNFKLPNKNINFEESPVYIVDQLTPWETEGYSRRCGVNAFGFSGTNCHVILEEVPVLGEKPVLNNLVNGKTLSVFTLSAKSDSALEGLLTEYRRWFNKENALDIRDICYLTNNARGHYSERLAIVVSSYSELKDKLNELSGSKIYENQIMGIYYGKHRAMANNISTKNDYELTEKAKKDLSNRVMEKTQLFLESDQTNREILNEICQLYVKGAEVDWEKFYQGENIKKIRLPVYPFDKLRCWLEIPGVIPELEETGLYFSIFWRREEIKQTEFRAMSDQNIMIINCASQCQIIDQKMLAFLREKCKTLIEVEIGPEYQKINGHKFMIRNIDTDYQLLLSECREIGLNSIIHSLSLANKNPVTSLEELTDQLDQGIYSLFFLTKALQKTLLSQELRLFVISYCASEVTGHEQVIKPENVTLFGLGKIIGRENPEITYKAIDVDDCFSIEMIYPDLVQDFTSNQVAYRDGKRFVEEFSEIEISSYQLNEPVVLKDSGIYIITGGTGGIGLEIAKYLTSKNQVKLALINRSKFPKREQWPEIINNAQDLELCNKIAAIQVMERNGSEVSFYSADISNFNEVEAIIKELKLKYHRINGIIHSAGVSSYGFICDKSEQVFNQVINPKVKGAWILENLTQDDNLDFFVMFSSVAVIFGAPGQGDYVAGNLYLDSLAAMMKKKGRKAITIDWVQWLETGMAVATKINVNTIFKALPTRQGIKAFDEIIHSGLNHVLVGEINYGEEKVLLLDSFPLKFSAKLRRNLENQKCIFKTELKNVSKNQIGQVNLAGRDDGIYTETEKMIAQVWGEVLGYNELRVDDNFYELGGDSILAIRIVNRISGLLNKKLSITNVLTAPTISELSKYLESVLFSEKKEEDQELLAMINKIEGLNDENISKLLVGEEKITR
jgi:acyl transferase domain-containing protein/acyl carrier protein